MESPGKRPRTGSAAPAAPQGEAGQKPHLVVHLDVNKTVIICDPVSGMTLELMVNSLLSEVAWGTLRGNGVDSEWTLDAQLTGPSTTPPSSQHVSFGDWVENVRKLPRKERKAAKGAFTDCGHPGESLRPHFERLVSALQLPPEARAAVEGSPRAPRQLRAGQIFLLPAFFHLVRHLETTRRNYSIVFRTFGVDLPDVAEEFNAFLEGTHPSQALPDGVSPESLAHRRMRLPECSCNMHRTVHADSLAFVCGETKLVKIESGFQNVMRLIEERSLTGETLAIQDCFGWWSKQGESDTSGKLVGADLSLLGAGMGKGPDGGRRFHHVFFDDNIERDRPHIVDCRDRATGEPVPFEVSLNRFIVRSEPLLAIEDPEFFVRALAVCEQAVASHAPSAIARGE